MSFTIYSNNVNFLTTMAGRGRGNAWNRGSVTFGPTSKPGIKNEKVVETNKASINKQAYSSSEEEDDDNNSDDILGKVLQTYAQLGGASHDLGRTQLFLEEVFQSGSATCLICISTVGKNEAIWNCCLCYCFFHLNCLQRWAQESIMHQKRALEEQPLNTAPDFCWSCPKCRHMYPESEIPSKYLCFCGKRVDPPPYSGWHVPHSCGETCGRELTPSCGHSCPLLCHPGPCPPCPRQVTVSCQCGRQPPKAVRCSGKVWSCGQPCRKVLPCNNSQLRIKDNAPVGRGRGKFLQHLNDTKEARVGKDEEPHLCLEICHSGPCMPCPRKSLQPCRCGKESTMRPCSEMDWQCKQCCDGHCPPCDKICSKMLSCGKHRCPAPCHRGPCYPCPLMVTISCPCKSTSIKVPCGQERRIKGDAKRNKGVIVKCRKPCKLPSQCQHPPRPHTCHSGECPSCRDICGIVREGSCGHACSAKCHTSVWVKEEVEAPKKPAGPWEKPQDPKIVKKCLPCPPCTTRVEVICLGGHEKSFQPCHSASPYCCGRECGRLLPCTTHSCTFPCHHVKGGSKDLEHEPALAGKNCEPCNNPCLKPRPNGCSHACPLGKCHPGDCPSCKQNMKQKCHCGLSPAMFIECRKWVAALEEDSKAEKGNSKEQSCIEKLLSCGNQCPKLLSCGHRCEITCHSGPCPADVLDGKSGGEVIQCTQKVRVTCPCGLLKQRRICKDVHAFGSDDSAKGKKDSKSLVLLECNEECKLRKEEVTRAREESAERKRKEEERRNAEELEKFKLKQEGRRGRTRRRRDREDLEDDGNIFRRHWIMISIMLSIAAVGIAVFMLTETNSK
ncbi:hypothetical protein J437_LFUL011110 [Ladona fulva]|uniref:NF-X1-type domain-containing protein n=1 Tax=Ladona fulva TaxID=123851 RepID=A0A8K0KA65_LADFU|nr:hypothetical protein J437_LFUL011110 [Ladona fulva]